MKNNTTDIISNKISVKQLFFSLLKISATTFGGGFVIVPLLKSRFVDELHQLDEDEMLDLMAIAQSCPGPIAVNASILVGYRIFGLKGGFVALLATVLPPLTIISIISLFYNAFRSNHLIQLLMAGMLCGVTAIVLNVVVEMIGKLNKSVLSIFMLIAAFIMNLVFKVNILIILGTAALIGIFEMLLNSRRRK